MGYTSFNLSAVSFMRPDYVPADASQAEYDKKVIQPGLVDHEAFEVVEEPVRSRVQESQMATVKKKKTGKITIFDQETLDRLRAWEKENIPIHVYGAGNECLVWEKPSQFNITRSLKTKEGLQGFDIELTTSDSLQNSLIKWGTNLLYLKNGVFQDSDLNGLADNYSSTTFNNTFVDGIQKITSNQGGQSFFEQLVFPVKTNKFNAYLYSEEIGLNKDLSQLKLIARDYQNNILQESASNINVIGGVNSTINSNSRVYFLEYRILTRATAGNNFEFDFKDPSVSYNTLTGKADY